jgi:hypothetical protein
LPPEKVAINPLDPGAPLTTVSELLSLSALAQPATTVALTAPTLMIPGVPPQTLHFSALLIERKLVRGSLRLTRSAWARDVVARRLAQAAYNALLLARQVELCFSGVLALVCGMLGARSWPAAELLVR